MKMDNRAVGAIGNLRTILALAVGAIVIWIVNAVASPLLNHAGESGDGQVADQGTQWLTEGINYLPVFFLLIVFFGAIAAAVYEREVAR